LKRKIELLVKWKLFVKTTEKIKSEEYKKSFQKKSKDFPLKIA
jgi:hypothetical protein